MKSGFKNLILAIFVLVCCTAAAVIMRPLSIEELSKTADVVVQGVVTGKTCLRDAEGRIYTRVELQVSDVFKGTGTSNTLSIVHGGGTIGNERQQVAGQVEYVIGEEVVAFLIRNPRGQLVTVGLCQGKFSVWKNEAGEKRVRNPFHAGALSATALSDASSDPDVAATPRRPEWPQRPRCGSDEGVAVTVCDEASQPREPELTLRDLKEQVQRANQ